VGDDADSWTQAVFAVLQVVEDAWCSALVASFAEDINRRLSGGVLEAGVLM